MEGIAYQVTEVRITLALNDANSLLTEVEKALDDDLQERVFLYDLKDALRRAIG